MSGTRSLRGLNGPTSFRRFLQVPEAGADGTLRDVCDGEGDILPLRISTTGVEVTVAPTTPDGVANKAYVDSVAAPLTLPLAIADGGTGNTTAAGARTALGATTTGSALFTAANASAGRAALGAGGFGELLFATGTAISGRATMDCPLAPTAARLIPMFIPSSTAVFLPTLSITWAWVLLVFDAGTLVSVSGSVQAGGGAAVLTTTATQVAGGFRWQVA